MLGFPGTIGAIRLPHAMMTSADGRAHWISNRPVKPLQALP